MRPAAIGVGPGVDRVSQDLEDGQQDRTPPLQVPAIGPVERTKPEADVVADQVVEDPPGGADLVVLVEDETDDLADLLIGVHLDPFRGELDVAGGHAVKEFAALGLVQPASFQSISHSNKLEFADGAFQAEQEPVVGILGVVDAVLVREERPEDGTHLQKIVPILVVAGDAAHLDPEDQADMLHGNLGQEALESAPLVGRPAAVSLIVIDDQDAIPGPSPGDRVVGEGILPLPRLAMVENLLGIGLAHVNDSDAVEVEIEDLEGSQDAGLADRLVESAVAGLTRSAWLVGSRLFMIGLLVGGRPWELLSDDAAEGQERPMAIGLGECLPEVRQRDAPGRLRWRGGDWTGGMDVA